MNVVFYTKLDIIDNPNVDFVQNNNYSVLILLKPALVVDNILLQLRRCNALFAGDCKNYFRLLLQR